jgi:hydroxypyruvate isomerase
MKFSVCIDAVLSKYDIDDALELVSRSGIPAFEFWGWWNRDLDRLLKARDRFQLHIAACCTKFISLVDPTLRDSYLRGLEESIAAAKRLACPTLISQVGDFRPGFTRQEQHQSLVDGLKAAAPLVEEAGITLVIEPLNELVDHAGYFLIRSQEAFEIVEEVDSPRVRVVFDIYHQQVSEGHLIHNITANLPKIGHFHAAGNPGRHELTIGEIHYPAIIDVLRSQRYEGYFGLEYWPVFEPEAGLRRIADWLS